MLNKRLLGIIPDIGTKTAVSVFFQWLSMICSISITVCICILADVCFIKKSAGFTQVSLILTVILLCIILRCIFTKLYSENSAQTARSVKKKLRSDIFSHLCKIGASYKNYVSTAEAVQVSVEGIDQLETYFSQYMPQLFFSIASVLTLFVLLLFINIPTAFVLLMCVPLIPLAIAAVQKLAKKLLAKYWNSYTTLGDSFLENIQGLTTLKIYQCDDIKHREMNKNAEDFRKATMRVLIMQLNSIAIMDIVAYGGSAAAIIMALLQFSGGKIDFVGAMIIILLSAEFFIPLRRLGSFFHIAMNGAAAADKILRILDICPPKDGTKHISQTNIDITFDNVSYSYTSDKTVLKNINLHIPQKGLYAFVGKSGCGKSTLAGILTGQNTGCCGNITLGGYSLSDISRQSLYNTVTLVTHNSYIFKGTVRYNLTPHNKNISDEQMISVLKKVRLWDFLCTENRLDTKLSEQGSNLSGGQRQRLAIARALLHDTPVYIFDEASSNIDAESENAINDIIAELSAEKSVIVISHRLASIVGADKIFVLNNGMIVESGTHSDLLKSGGEYSSLYNLQAELENFTAGGDIDE